MTVDVNVSVERDNVQSLSTQRNEPEWLLEKRLEALKLSESLPLPKVEKTKIDKWSLLSDISFTEEDRIKDQMDLPDEIKSFLGQGNQAGNLLIYKNGSTVYQSIQKDWQEKGVIFTDIQTALKEHPELVKKHLYSVVGPQEHKVSALHVALANSGLFLYVPKHVEIDVPFQSVFWQQAASLLAPHVLIIADDYSKLTYVENVFGLGEEVNVCNYVAEVVIGMGAKVTFAAVDNLAKGTTSYMYRRAQVGQNGRIDWALGQMNAGDTISDNTTVLLGNGSTGDTKSVVVGTGSQSLNFVQKMHQFGHHTDGQMLSHGVMKDEARAIFNGITKIEKGAFKSTGEQAERVLMLSPKSRGDANPILLIDENVERAGHAASVGKVNEMQLYYLMSRGLSRAEAERLIILGFLAPVIENIPLKGLREQLIAVIERKIKS
jgi:Fe-S cluster assembly protein SufD